MKIYDTNKMNLWPAIGIVVVLLALSLSQTECTKYEPPQEMRVKYSNIVKVMSNGNNSVTIFTKHGKGLNQTTLRAYNANTGKCQVKYIDDVASDMPMYAIVTEKQTTWSGYRTVEVHIHGVENIDGGTINRGKFPDIKVHVIE